MIRVIKSNKNNILKQLQVILSQFEVHQTDEWIYVNGDNPNYTLAIFLDDYPKYEILDQSNMAVETGEWTIEAAPTFSKEWIKELAENIIDTLEEI